MPQINLLKQTAVPRTYGSFKKTPALVMKIVAGLGICVVAYYVWLVMKVDKTKKEIVDTKTKITLSSNDAASTKERDELLTRQSQLKELQKLISGHIYWSGIFPELAKATLKKASYTSLYASSDGGIVLMATVPNLQEFDKYLQVFDQKEFYENFSNVRVGALHKSSESGDSSLNFEVKFKFNTGLLDYQAVQTKK